LQQQKFPTFLGLGGRTLPNCLYIKKIGVVCFVKIQVILKNPVGFHEAGKKVFVWLHQD
jgi:hypothetical protein